MWMCTTLGFTVPLTVILSAIILRGTENRDTEEQESNVVKSQ